MQYKPTQQQIDSTREVLQYILASTEMHHPDAYRSLEHLRGAINELDITPDDLEEDIWKVS